MSKIYNIRVESPFVLLPRQVKEKLGIGYKVLAIEVESEINIPDITDIDSATEAIVKIGFRALARAFHPDLAGPDTANTMAILNKSKKELLDLLATVKA